MFISTSVLVSVYSISLSLCPALFLQHVSIFSLTLNSRYLCFCMTVSVCTSSFVRQIPLYLYSNRDLDIWFPLHVYMYRFGCPLYISIYSSVFVGCLYVSSRQFLSLSVGLLDCYNLIYTYSSRIIQNKIIAVVISL